MHDHIGQIALGIVGFLAFWWLITNWIRYIPNTSVGIVEKLISGKGSLQTGIIALNGEAGFQPEVLRGGWHLRLPLQYRVHRVPLVTIAQGKVGYVFARDGVPLNASQALAGGVKADDFMDVAQFLTKGGQRGPQRTILREGTYAINLVQFVVLTDDRLYYLPLDGKDEAIFRGMADLIDDRDGFGPVVITGHEDMVGIVTVHDGPSLPSGQIIAPLRGDDPQSPHYHNNFQDPDAFLAAGGQRGRQLQVMVEGTYYVNRLFATVELVPKTMVEVGNVGVVVSYTGETGTDITGSEYKHGELVANGTRGVWSAPLLPGKYAFNTYAGKVISVPTTNFILKWTKGEVGSHKFDENLAEVSLITKDAFEPNLPLSVVVHIDYKKAPLVIQRFGDIKKLVEQTLDPMVSAFFKNVGQTRTLIELLQDRSAIQQMSAEQMRDKFSHYNLELQEVLIGTPSAGQSGQQLEQMLHQLRARQIAAEQVETYTRQERAAVQERELREAEAKARQQQILTESEISIMVQSNQGKAEFARAQQQASQIQTLATAEAEKIRIMAEGEAKRIRALAEADADKTARVGIAQALAIEEQVRAYGGPQFQLAQQVMNRFAEAVENSKVDVVPKIQMTGGGGATGGLLESLLQVVLSDKLGQMLQQVEPAAAKPEAENLKADLRSKIGGKA